MQESNDSGVIDIKSAVPVGQTADLLSAKLISLGLTIFATIDQQAAATEAGQTMRPMVLLIFGNPAAGTPLMIAHPTLAIDLPLKALVWENANGQVLVTINSPEYLQKRHGLPNPPFAALRGWIEAALQ